VKKRKLLNSK